MAAEVEPVSEEVQAAIERAAAAIRTAPALLITAGSGLGVDSGLPDFRGNAGFWKAYPPFEQLGLSFSELANPIWFERDPQQAWGFYGHRYQLYRDAVPHAGYAILRRWGEARPAGYFVFTSNVDGQFQRGLRPPAAAGMSRFDSPFAMPRAVWRANLAGRRVETGR